jgi:peptidoglycan-associated lipoprotein
MMRIATVSPLALVVLAPFVVAVAACGHKEFPPPKVPSSTTGVATPAPPYTPPKNPAVNLSDDIMKACNIVVNNVQEAPKFDFNSTELSASEKDIMSQVAKCLMSGPLKGRSVQLVGRADPRGEQEYNMELGENRASTVKKYLTELGVEANRVSLTSRGKLDATGTDEEGWRKDRRVDVNLSSR